MRYAAPWDRKVHGTTRALLVLVVLVAAVVVFASSRLGGPVAGALGAFALAVLGGVVLFAWALSPTGYAIEGGTLRIERRLRPLTVPLARVTAVARIAELWAGGAARVGGSSGLFGHFGTFWNRTLGAFRLFATRTTDLVLLELPDDRLLVSPDSPERFVEEVRAAAPGALRVEDPEALGRRPLPRRARLVLAAAILAVPLLVGAVLLATAAFAPVGAEVTGSSVRVERRLARAVEIPLASVRAVEVLPAPGGFRRIAGVHGPGISYGRFTSDDLGDFQLWDWGGPAYVLLDTADGAVVLTPDDPDGFVAAVRRAIAGR